MTTRRILWGTLATLSLFVAGYALLLLAFPEARPPFVRNLAARAPLALYGHLAGGAVALALGPFQFLTRLRSRTLRLHRLMGRGYVVAVAIGGVAGLVLATGSSGGPVARLGFGALAVGWLVTTGAAYRRIRAGNVQAHRRWMTRSFALTLAAVTLRLYLPASLAFGVPFETAYPAIAWLCWVPNLLVAEWLVRQPHR